MKILIVTYSYAPDLNPRSFRWTAVARELAHRGHEVHVLCAAPEDPSDDDAGVVVHRVRDPLSAAVARAGSAGSHQTASRSGLRSRLSALARGVWRGVRWPDYACGWIGAATRGARALCSTHRFDALVSVSHPFSGHVVGWRARRCAPHARWMVDIGDPFFLMRDPSPNNRLLYAALSRRVEAKILAKADVVSVTTEPTRQAYVQHFGLPADKIRVIEPLLSLPPDPAPSSTADDGVTRLVFVGTLYRKLRSPRFLLTCFTALRSALPRCRLELHFYGATNDCGDELRGAVAGNEASVFVHGLVSRAAAHQAMVDAKVLVNIGNLSETQLASKVIEYMAMGKPILNLTRLAADPSVQSLVDYPAALSILHDDAAPDAGTIDKIAAFIQDAGDVPARVKADIRGRYAAATIADKYESLLLRPAGGEAKLP
jgi:glycosyltransferase involved in cell wall biosynthesis